MNRLTNFIIIVLIAEVLILSIKLIYPNQILSYVATLINVIVFGLLCVLRRKMKNEDLDK